MFDYKIFHTAAVWLLFISASSLNTSQAARVVTTEVPTPPPAFLVDTSPPSLPDQPSIEARPPWLVGPGSPPSPVINPPNLNKSLMLQLASNTEKMGATLICLADQTNDSAVVSRLNQIFDSSSAYVKEMYRLPLSDQGKIDIGNVVALNTLVYLRGVHEKCANLTNPYTPANTPAAGKNFAELGNLFQTIGTTMDCLILKIDPKIIPQVPVAVGNAFQAIANDPRTSVMDILLQHEAALASTLLKMSRICLG
ncbi:uncharacterized protein LOC106090699 [Stomoxys calcitrans]|uniref:uncharacterized protein LOC106090699 n=1 Tax=Stomoxys calcitrans TaxID=35570 RepID=UPI0027E2E769|nr:uncharacterized protein LOC106090699 [Stomoxys calcitrans]XP_059224276.1 uncharacterized protein LOC106090699 [Stomoxys calcitrans]